MKLLIDECLSPVLATRARERGHVQSSHVVWMKRGGWPDWRLTPFILEGDWTFVTRNAVDFRGPAAKPGSSGQYANVAVHAGLVCLHAPSAAGLGRMAELFDLALDELARDGDLINQVLEVTLENAAIHMVRYALPS